MNDGSGVVTVQTHEGVVKYKGDFNNDKRHGKCDELSLTDLQNQKQVVYRGRCDQNEELSGQGQIDLK